jgi:autotransporter translocation and assembly factor TamB
VLDPEDRAIDLTTLAITFRRAVWRLVETDRPRVSWDEGSVSVHALTLADATGAQQISIDGTWRSAGGGALTIIARRVFLDTFAPEGQQPVRYGGVLDLDVTLSGTRDLPVVTGQISIIDGRIRRLSYQKLAGGIGFADGIFQIDLRLDQASGVWLTATGSLPMGVFDPALPDKPMNVAIASSSISLGLVEGVTDVVRDVSGQLRVDVKAVGSSRDPHFDGTIDVTDAAFLVAASGARYKNGRAVLRLSVDRMTVESLHVEDRSGNPLDVRGSLGTHELRVGSLEIDATARGFEVLRNEFGRIGVDMALTLRGQLESPRAEGRITVTGGELNVDMILDRALFRPYSTRPATIPDVDAIAALNPWERLGLGIELHVPNTLRLIGENVQVTTGTPIGFGNINLRLLGDLYLYKDRGQPLYVNGSFDQVTGTYVFQGRRFDLEPTSSINFHGDLNPELFVTVTREISGVQTRVTIAGPLQQPELRLASTPALDASDILSLIVFNTSTNELSALEQQQLAVRAGTLAAAFLVAPIMTAVERTLGLSMFEIEPGVDIRGGTRVTIGDEIAPGLVARFSRQFGLDEYDEVTIEYSLSRIFRLRATFSDAGTLLRSPFRRVERAGVDLIIFFSF